MPDTASKPRGETSWVRLTKLPAALLTRPSSGPPSAQIAPTIRSTASASRMSSACVLTLPPCSAISASAVASSTALRRPHRKRSAPSSRYFDAISRPSPEPPPVTRMRFPFSNPAWNMGSLLLAALIERDLARLDHRAPFDALGGDVGAEIGRLRRLGNDHAERLELAAAALVRDVDHLRSGLDLQQLAGEVERAADAGRAVVELAGLRLGLRDQVGERAHRRVGANDDDERRYRDACHGHELRRVVGELRV